MIVAEPVMNRRSKRGELLDSSEGGPNKILRAIGK